MNNTKAYFRFVKYILGERGSTEAPPISGDAMFPNLATREFSTHYTVRVCAVSCIPRQLHSRPVHFCTVKIVFFFNSS